MKSAPFLGTATPWLDYESMHDGVGVWVTVVGLERRRCVALVVLAGSARRGERRVGCVIHLPYLEGRKTCHIWQGGNVTCVTP